MPQVKVCRVTHRHFLRPYGSRRHHMHTLTHTHTHTPTHTHTHTHTRTHPHTHTHTNTHTHTHTHSRSLSHTRNIYPQAMPNISKKTSIYDREMRGKRSYLGPQRHDSSSISPAKYKATYSRVPIPSKEEEAPKKRGKIDQRKILYSSAQRHTSSSLSPATRKAISRHKTILSKEGKETKK